MNASLLDLNNQFNNVASQEQVRLLHMHPALQGAP
jgi:hypothetical protein